MLSPQTISGQSRSHSEAQKVITNPSLSSLPVSYGERKFPWACNCECWVYTHNGLCNHCSLKCAILNHVPRKAGYILTLSCFTLWLLFCFDFLPPKCASAASVQSFLSYTHHCLWVEKTESCIFNCVLPTKGKHFYSSSESEEEEESHKKFNIKIKPLQAKDILKNAATVDELKASIGNIALSPSPVVSGFLFQALVRLDWQLCSAHTC